MKNKESVIYLKEMDCENNGDIIIFNELIDIDDFSKRLNDFWDELTEQDDWEYDEMYDFISKNWNVKEFIFIDNLRKVRF